MASSGNGFPNRLDDKVNQASKDFDVILVGSFSPRGFVSNFSQSGKEISILAPSDKWLTSAGEDGEYTVFGGTSGAAPLVTGSLAGFEWLSGYHPTAKEAKVLLEKTALPTLHSSFEKPRINGAGLLNTYKLGEVAKRLKEKCKNKSISCFKEEILKDENYRFSEDKSLRGDMEKFFPSCAPGEGSSDILSPLSCEEKGQVFKRLRKAVLLNPNQELLESLSCIYKEGGFLQNAEALDNLALAFETQTEELISKLKVNLREATKFLNDNPRSWVKTKEDMELLAQLDKQRNLKVKAQDDLLRLLFGMREFNSLTLHLERGFRIAGGMGETGLPLLEKGFATENVELQKMALDSAGRVGEAGLPLLEKGFATENVELQKVVLWSAAKQAPVIGEAGLPLLEKGLVSGDQELQLVILVHITGYTKQEVIPMLKHVLTDNTLSEEIKTRIRDVLNNWNGK